jgi:hypothetical protein
LQDSNTLDGGERHSSAERQEGWMTDVQRLGGIVVAPSRTFEDISRRPSWIIPFALLLIFNLAINFIVYRVLVTPANLEQVALAKIHWDASAAKKDVSTAEAGRLVDAIRVQRDRWYLVPLFSVLVSTLALSIFFYLLLRLMRAEATFLKVFAVVCWSFVIYRCIGGAFTIITLLVRGSANFFPAPAEAWSPTSVAHLVSRASVNANIYSAISKLDVFLLWWLAIMAVGFAKVSKNLTLRGAITLVATSEVLYLLANGAGWLGGAS